MSSSGTDQRRSRSTEDEIAEKTLEFCRNVAFPWFWLYPDEPLTRRFLKWWWVYALFAVGTGILFFEQILAGEYQFLVLVPVFHIVLLGLVAQMVGPMIDPSWPIANAALRVPVPAPWRVGAVTAMLAVVGGLSLSSKGMPGSTVGSLRRASVEDDEMPCRWLNSVRKATALPR